MIKTYIEEINTAPLDLRKAVKKLSEKQLNTPYRPNGWTVKQVVHHLPDSHLNCYIRFKLALTETEPTVKTYDEAKWAELPDTFNTPVQVSLVLLESLHMRWVNLMETLSREDFNKTFRHPEYGLVTLARTAGLYAWHGKHHIAHITSLKNRMGW